MGVKFGNYLQNYILENWQTEAYIFYFIYI
jgi:hypothetical protein